jgi:small conductance mechanosensitive channel
MLKLRIKTVPSKQWEVGRELRKRIRSRFAEEHIEIPFPERVVTVREDREDDKPGTARDAASAG